MKQIHLLTAVLIMGLGVVTSTPAQTEGENGKPNSTQVKDPLALLANVRKDLDGLQAHFTQYELSANNEKLDPNSGQVWMQTPAQFRWQYVEPVEQLIVADGEQVWVYDEDLEQVTVKNQDNQLNPIYVIINDEMSQQHYAIKHEMTSQAIDWISLTPKEINEEVKTVWLAVHDDTIKQIKVVNNFGQTMVFEFSDIKKNPEFEAEMFIFVPPEGVDVVKAIDQ